MSLISLAVLLTSHNRCSQTLYAINEITTQRLGSGIEVRVYLADAGSTDGTPRAVRSRFPDVVLMEVGPELFWNRGMHVAFQAAMDADHDFYLWLNDDTQVDKDAIHRALDTFAKARHPPALVVGAARDPESGVHTYGAYVRRKGLHPLKFDRVPIGDTPSCADTMNGNFVLIPAQVAQNVGNLDWKFSHSIGDFDYGLRATRLGYDIITIPGTVGTCRRNSSQGTWEDRTLSIRTRWQKLMSPKGLPPKEWRIFCRRHAGWKWVVVWPFPYLRFAAMIVVGK